MNTTTAITLNDRFSLIKSPNGAPNAQRGRSRSRSRSRATRPQQLRGSVQNRKLLDQLEKQHKMRLAMKLKNKSIIRSRGRAQGQIIRKQQQRVLRNPRNFKRANSLTTFVPLNDAPRRGNNAVRGRSRSRSRSRNQTQQVNRPVTDRLGIPGRQLQRRMRRPGPVANGAQLQQQQRTGRSRSRSRVRLNRNNFPNNRNGNNQAPKRSQSVNSRLGNNAPAQIRRRRRLVSNTRNPNTQLNRPLAGRIVKRGQRNPVGARVQRNLRQNGNAFGANSGRGGGRVAKRGASNAQTQARGRQRGRGQMRQTGQGAARRGRSRTRRGGNNSNGRGGGKGGGVVRGQVSKDQLDKQLDDYMSKGSA